MWAPRRDPCEWVYGVRPSVLSPRPLRQATLTTLLSSHQPYSPIFFLPLTPYNLWKYTYIFFGGFWSVVYDICEILDIPNLSIGTRWCEGWGGSCPRHGESQTAALRCRSASGAQPCTNLIFTLMLCLSCSQHLLGTRKLRGQKTSIQKYKAVGCVIAYQSQWLYYVVLLWVNDILFSSWLVAKWPWHRRAAPGLH